MAKRGVKKILFLNLTAFSQTGGLEKFNRCFLKALNETEEDYNGNSTSYSLYDQKGDDNYYPPAKYRGYSRRRIKFVAQSVVEGAGKNVVVLGHINLAVIGILIKLISPKTKLMLICHGIEVWGPVSAIQKKLLDKADKILAVSSYTKQKLVDVQHLPEGKVELFHNTIDPFFKVPHSFQKDRGLLDRYGLTDRNFVLFTLCRLSSLEKYKGYDAVIKAMPALLSKHPSLKYLIGGKYDAAEKHRLDALVDELGVKESVIFTGYIDDKEIIAHYQLGDVYIMPSKGEGFGIVFIEAMACGSRVIAGNKDGSVDALKDGELGTLVDPERVDEIANAIENCLMTNWNAVSAQQLQQKALDNFGFDVYKKRLGGLMSAIVNN